MIAEMIRRGWARITLYRAHICHIHLTEKNRRYNDYGDGQPGPWFCSKCRDEKNLRIAAKKGRAQEKELLKNKKKGLKAYNQKVEQDKQVEKARNILRRIDD